ncbi:hypothetical protein MP638_002922 [Amoeboaphelidium occidentale]|nr:hypothetical protein MP638_002922 [Amoeboaphelidium occidentale]
MDHTIKIFEQLTDEEKMKLLHYQLSKEEYRQALSAEEKKQLFSREERIEVLKEWTAKKPSVKFSSASIGHCSREDGLNLDVKFLRTTAPSLHLPENFPRPEPSESFCQYLDRIMAVWVLDNEKSCRIFIDALITEVLMDESNEELMGFCEVPNDWEGPGFGYTGTVDYMLGSSITRTVESIDSFLLIVEAKKEWPDSAVPQTVCEAGCLLRKRLAAGKNTPVFAVLTNSYFFRFFAIDTDGVVYASRVSILDPGTDGSYCSSTTLPEILQWFYWMMETLKSVSPRAFGEDLTKEAINSSINELRKCFGVKGNVSNKKKDIIKIAFL